MTELLDCGHPPTPTEGPGTGYGKLKNEETGEWEKHCYHCGAETERNWMIVKGKTVLYLVQTDEGAWEVTDWPGKLRFTVYHHRQGNHNWGIPRYDVWFNGPDEHGGYTARWWGVQYGDNTQICHCRRTRRTT